MRHLCSFAGKMIDFLSPKRVVRGILNPREAGRHIRKNLRQSKAERRLANLDYEELAEQRRPELAALFDTDVDHIRQLETELYDKTDFLEGFEHRWNTLEADDDRVGSTSRFDAETLYLTTRLAKPSVILETGCRYGSFDAYIIEALADNGTGELHAIDLPDEPPRGFGYLIPDDRMNYWTLHKGDVNDMLTDVLDEIGPVDLFLHDSIHKRSHMRWEYKTASKYLSENGVIASHDLMFSNAFQEFTEGPQWKAAIVGNTGVAKSV